MSAHDALHLVAIGLTLLAVGIHAGWRSRSSIPGLIAAILMLAAMADTAFVHLLSIVVWTPLLLVVAIGLAAARSVRRHPVGTSASRTASAATHDPLGLVVTAAVLPLMHAGPVPAGDHGEHGASMGVLIAVVLSIAAGHLLGSLLACARSSTSAGRVQFAAMGLASLFMGLPVALAAAPL